MSTSMRRVKAVDFDEDDDDYDYEEGGEDEMSPEDQTKMQELTIKVKEELGPNVPVSERQIQDLLWNYYWDVERTVAELKTYAKPKEKKKKKTEQLNRFDQAANAAASKAQPKSNGMCRVLLSYFLYAMHRENILVAPLPVCHPSCWKHKESFRCLCPALYMIGSPRRCSQRSNRGPDALNCCDLSFAFAPTRPQKMAPADYFRGISWNRDEIPKPMLSNLIPQPRCPRGGLLGGSSKPSKLAALAAARKKKEEEKRTVTPASEPDQSERAIALLDRLTLKKENVQPLQSPGMLETSARSRFTSRQKLSEQSTEEPLQPEQQPEEIEIRTPPPDLRAVPSLFARAICQQPSADVQSDNLTRASSASSRQWSSKFVLPYANDPSYMKDNPFAKPSPDDVVLRAQSKGSLPPLGA